MCIKQRLNLVNCYLEYRSLNGKIRDIEYLMLVDSGSELNIMTLQQAQDLALPSMIQEILGH